MNRRETETSKMVTSTTTRTTNPGSPIRTGIKSNTINPNVNQHTPTRARINSRDIPRSYARQFGQGGDDLLPFELQRNWHTDWLERGEFLWVYLGGVVLFEIIIHAVMDTVKYKPLFWSWTVTNAVHCLLSTIYLHWLKGSPFDEQGEMAALTLWEQLEGRQHTTTAKRALTIVPTLLCLAACRFSNYEYSVCVANICLWFATLAAKLPIMNGVRVFGINRTAGIDDYGRKDL